MDAITEAVYGRKERVMLQLDRLQKTNEILDSVYEEMLNGYIDEDLMQEAVDAQITINRIVFKLNQVYYGAWTERRE